MIDSMMNTLGFKRVATVQGNVITPEAFAKRLLEDDSIQCDICGDHDCDNPRSCETGDGE